MVPRVLSSPLFVAAFVCCASASLAEEMSDAYAGAHVGLLLLSFHEPEFTDLDLARDLTVGGTLGFFVAPGTSVEAGLGYAWGSDVEFEQQAEHAVSDDLPTGDILYVNGDICFWFGASDRVIPFMIAGIGVVNVGGVDDHAVFSLNGRETRRRIQTDATTDLAIDFGGGVVLRRPGIHSTRLEFRQLLVFNEDGVDLAARISAGVLFGR